LIDHCDNFGRVAFNYYFCSVCGCDVRFWHNGYY
jgi:hypothetical protein